MNSLIFVCKTSNGLKIPEGWGPFAYDIKDQKDPFFASPVHKIVKCWAARPSFGYL